MMGRTIPVCIGGLLVILVLLAGCTEFSGGGSRDSAMYTGASAPGNAAVKGIMEGSYGAEPVPTPVPTYDADTQAGTAGGQKIVYTARASIEVPDVPAAADSLKSLAAEKGGYIASSTLSTQYDNQKVATVVIRVPAKEFEATLENVRALGTVKSANTAAEDVTEEYIDLAARKASYQNQIAQYNQIMAKSEKVEDIIRVQDQIDRVQTELDRLEGKLRYLDSRIDLSTITVTLSEKEPVGGAPGHSFVSTLNQAFSGLIEMIDFLIVAFFTLLPLIIIAGIVYAGYRYYQRKKPKEKSPQDRPDEKEK